MNVSGGNENEQAAIWNGSAGKSWVAAQDALDEMFRPFEELLVQTAAAKPSTSVLDVGCGTGSTTLAIKKRLGAASHCVGVDISQPMLERARARAESASAAVSFIDADAEQYVFESARFDLIVSRFGVMFFNDPARAMKNLRLAARDGAELCFIAWRSPAENPFMTTAERAAGALLPSIPPRDLNGPGQFGFADPSKVFRLLEAGGWSDVDISPLDVECGFSRQDLALYVTRLGPLGRILQDADEATQARVLAAVLPAFDPYVHGASVHFNAACWKIAARAGSTR